MKRLPSILSIVLVSACATNPRPDTPSGNLEITLTGVRPDCVYRVAPDAVKAHGYRIESTANGRIVAGRQGPGDPREDRITVQFLPLPKAGAMRVVIYANRVTNPGTNFESLQPARPTAAQQDQFNIVKQRVERACASRNG